MEQAYRPSHADATYDFKYGIRAVRREVCVFLFYRLPKPEGVGGCCTFKYGIRAVSRSCLCLIY